MGKIEKVKLPNGEFEGEQIEISQTSEHWNHYLLEDGSAIKLKPVATKILRLRDVYDGAGNPIYLVQTNNVMTVDCPQNLKKIG